MQARFRPLTWVGRSTPAHARRPASTFRSGWSSTLELLDAELAHLQARDVVIEADFREQDIRLDGWPRANARHPQHPGVRISFGSKHGPLMYATDTHEHWQHNVRAIALGLQALRAVDRYGVTRRGEQYTGWRALPSAPAGAASGPMSPQAAAADLIRMAGDPDQAAPGDVLRDEECRERLYRAAARRAHPDAGGSTEGFQRLQAVMAVLRGEDDR